MNTNTPHRQLLLSATLAALLSSFTALAADGEKTTFKGLITRIQGDEVTISDVNNAQTTITLTPETTFKMRKGMVGARYETVQRGALITGLPITVDVVGVGDGYNAYAVSFESEEYRNARQMQASMASTNERMDKFGTYAAVATTTVLFASGSSKLSSQGKSDLLTLASKSKDTKDFRIVVQGFTDATGDADANQKLSARRAQAVTDFLQQQAGVSPGRVQEGDAMGVAADAGQGSNANARKVEVKLVVDRGVNPEH